MRPFEYVRARSVNEARTLVSDAPAGNYIAGGTDILNLLKDGMESADRLVDISQLPISEIKQRAGRLEVGALARMSDVAANTMVRRSAPVVSQALEASASPQIRHMATIGGNLLQRTRCWYFRDPGSPCNKRDPGSGCSAIEGENRMHAVLGGSSQCIAVQPSDLAVALLAVDASVVVTGKDGRRVVPIEDFYLLPGNTPNRETVMRSGDLITSVEIPADRLAARSSYLKLRERASFEFATVSVAVALQMNGDRVQAVRLAFGGVGTRPWRSRSAERELIGQRLTRASCAAAGRELVRGAVPREHNAFKVELVQRALTDALLNLGGRP
ncbi:xanthine dehydrogenase family protein subunit M [Nocardioides sp. 1609]|uniref:FAD binding domain-containing protein n=1 Tax=Nocardioides sp. 1609 TaxID=2508327 RepID=UPI0010702258|nr:xanthine dehydrogenase family protein subunit M [Nocardioides sp. 1609]